MTSSLLSRPTICRSGKSDLMERSTEESWLRTRFDTGPSFNDSGAGDRFRSSSCLISRPCSTWMDCIWVIRSSICCSLSRTSWVAFSCLLCTICYQYFGPVRSLLGSTGEGRWKNRLPRGPECCWLTYEAVSLCRHMRDCSPCNGYTMVDPRRTWPCALDIDRMPESGRRRE